MAIELLFRLDAYRQTVMARVTAVRDNGLCVDQTVFYPQGGGQSGDRGYVTTADGATFVVTDTLYADDRTEVLHQTENAAALEVGSMVTLGLDWPLRYARMRVHTALHLLSVVIPFPVSGGAIGDGVGRLDFNWPDADRDKADIQAQLQMLIDQDAPVTTRWISDEELLAKPTLVKTMSVKPPMGTGGVRLVEIEGLDLQPCGGTHVRRTGEIGRIAITGIEKKGRENRRVRMSLV